MRTTLAIDDDVLAAAKHLAQRQGRSTGEVVSSLARHGLALSTVGPTAVRNGIPLLARSTLGEGGSGQAVTLELVNQLRDEQP